MDNKETNICEKFTERLNKFRQASTDYKKITFADIAKATGYGDRGGEHISNMFNGNNTPFWEKSVLLFDFLYRHIPNFSLDSLFRDKSIQDEHLARKKKPINFDHLRGPQKTILQLLLNTNGFFNFLELLVRYSMHGRDTEPYNPNTLFRLLDSPCQQIVRKIRLFKNDEYDNDLPLIK